MANPNPKNRLPEKYLKNGGPGRPKGSGRSQALAILDEVCADGKVKAAIRKQLMEKALQNPMAFFMKVIVPLAPKDTNLTANIGDIILKVIYENNNPKPQSE